MKLVKDGYTLRISEVRALGATNANAVRDQARAAFADGQRNIEIDLSETSFLDSCGLGALVALHKTACARNGSLRLLTPTPSVRQILELTRMHRIFDVIKQ